MAVTLIKLLFILSSRVKEENFWRNYFYRVSLIKQSAQLTSLAQQTGKCHNLPAVQSHCSNHILTGCFGFVA